MTAPPVLLTTDGTYPCYRGGVSVWCDQLIHRLPEVPFHVLAITYSSSHSPLFKYPPNLVTQRIVPLWGAERLGARDDGLANTLLRRVRTSPSVIRSGFLDHFDVCVRSILRPGSPPEALATALATLHVYFRDFDFAMSVSSGETWDVFLRACRDLSPPGERLTIAEATNCMRWLQRYLAVTAVPLPAVPVVHSSMAGLAGIPGVIQKILTGSRFLLTEHGIFLRELYLSLATMKETVSCRRFLFSWYEAVALMNYRFADTVSSLCEFNRKWQIRIGADPAKICMIPNGIDPEAFRPRARAMSSNVAPTILTMARIYPLKGIIHLLDAVRLVVDRMPSARFRILGETGDEEYHRRCRDRASELGIADSVEWGQTDKPAEAYATADVFCLPSISEALPYSVLEAMFSGCPVVATDVGGVGEILSGAGLIVPPGNPEALARALLSLLEGQGAEAYRADLAAKALVRAQTQYTIERCSDRFRDIYVQLCQTPKTTSLLAAR